MITQIENFSYFGTLFNHACNIITGQCFFFTITSLLQYAYSKIGKFVPAAVHDFCARISFQILYGAPILMTFPNNKVAKVQVKF